MSETPEEAIHRILPSLPEGAFVTASVVIVTFEIPGADPDERGPWLRWRADGQCGRWTHLGMVETVANDCRLHLGEPRETE